MNIQRKNSAHHFRMQSEREQTLVSRNLRNHLESTTIHSSEASGVLLIIIIIQYKITVNNIYVVIQSIHMISFLFIHSSESSCIAMSMMSLEEMKEAGMVRRGFKVLQTQGDLLW